MTRAPAPWPIHEDDLTVALEKALGKGGRYVFAMPDVIPDGMVLVHNHVVIGITPRRQPGFRGFRAWLSPKGHRGIEACGCGWAPHLGQHWRDSSTCTRRAAP